MLKLKVNSLYSLEAFIRTDNVLCWLIISCLYSGHLLILLFASYNQLGQKREQTLFHCKLFKCSCLVHAKGKPFGADVQRASYSFMRIDVSMTLKLQWPNYFLNGVEIR